MIAAYVTFNGNATEAFEFYKTALGGNFTNFQRFGDSPHGDQMADAEKKKLMHVTLEAPGDIILMGNDHMDFMGAPFQAGNNFSLSLHPGTEALADELFAKLSAGGMVIMPMAKAPWGGYFGMFMDKFGIKWLVHQQPK